MFQLQLMTGNLNRNLPLINNNSNIFYYKSKTEDLLAEIKSFILNQKAKIRQKKKPNPSEKKLL